MSDAFDASTRTWTLRSYAAVSAALRDTAFSDGDDNSIRAAVRGAARDLFPAPRLRAWRESLEASARGLTDALPSDAPVDLMAALAEPWSLELAAGAARISLDDAARHTDLARHIFLDAAMATGVGRANDAALALATALSDRPATNAIDVQSFVAISQTLPHLLVAVWNALFAHPEQIGAWRSLGDKSNAVDELLRYAGPSRAVFRTARRDTGDISAGDDVVLMLADANFDASVFAAPDRLDLRRSNASQHVALGAGRHPCVGASIVRLAVEIATDALLTRVAHGVVVEDVAWLDGFAIRAPAALTVRVARGG